MLRMFLGSLLLAAGFALADEDPPRDDEQQKTAERFLLVLERNPRPGTALDRVLEFHAERGSLDEFVTRLRGQAAAADTTKPDDAGRAWMVVGLVEASRGETELAIEALARAEQLLPTNAMASFALGQNLGTLNRWSEAAAALERAIERKPAPIDLLEVFQSLGRVQQRLASGDEIVTVWSRLEKLVPNDPRVPELIARTLLDDGFLAAALPRFEALAKAAKDPNRRCEFELEVIDIRLKLGQTEQALADSDRLLSTLKPEHWLFRETRRRVEEAFLDRDDLAGLVKHYEDRLAKSPDDRDAVVRLSRALVGQGKIKDGRAKLETAIKSSPSSAELRLELIELLQQEQQFDDVVAQYEQIDRIAPNHPDYVRDWGFAVLRRAEGGGRRAENDGQERTRHAGTIWQKLVDAKPKDALVAAQVARLMRQTDLLDAAADLLRRAIELAPETNSHREELGEVLDALKKKDAALAAWRSMAEPPRRTAENLGQLAVVLARFGYRDESLKTIDAACELDGKSIELRFQQIGFRQQWKQFESARDAIAAAYELADSPEEFDRVVQREIDVLSQAELLTTAIEEIKAEGESRKAEETNSALRLPPSALAVFRLARLLEAASQLREATIAAQKAVALAPKIGLFLQAAAQMLAQDNQWQPAIDMHHKLIAADRRFRADSLRSIAELEIRLGRKERAIQAARDLLAATPRNPDQAEFAADVLLRFGLHGDALHVLRRTSRQNPGDKRLALKLSEQLLAQPDLNPKSKIQNQKSTPSPIDEARDALWRVFEQSAKLDDRVDVIRKLAELAALPGEFDKLVQRLQRLRQQPKLARDATFCLAQVHEQSGDASQARRELERLLPQQPRDVELLKRLSALCEASGDLDAAIVHQRRVVDLSAGRAAATEPPSGNLSHDERLIALLRKTGRSDEAAQLSASRLESERDPARLLREIDRLLADGKSELALRVIRRQLDNDSTDWEFVHREAVALQTAGQTRDAGARFEALLALSLPDDTPSVLSANRPMPSNGANRSLAQRLEQLKERLRVAGRIRLNVRSKGESFIREIVPPNRAAGIQSWIVESSGPSRNLVTTPLDFGQARVIAMAVQAQSQADNKSADDSRDPQRRVWDDLYFAWVEQTPSRFDAASRKLLDQPGDDPLAKWAAIQSLGQQRIKDGSYSVSDWKLLEGNNPLQKTHLEKLLAADRTLRAIQPPLPWDVALPALIGMELSRARRIDDVQKMLAEVEASATTTAELRWLLAQSALNDDLTTSLRVFSKLVHANEAAQSSAAAQRVTPALAVRWLVQMMPRRAARDATDRRLRPDDRASRDVLQIVDTAINGLSSSEFFAHSGSTTAVAAGWQVWRGSTMQPTNVPFPPQVDTVESAAMHVLFQAFIIAKDQDWLPELAAHVAKNKDQAKVPSVRRTFWELASACLIVWNDTPEDALPALRNVFRSAEHRPSLQLAIAVEHQRAKQDETALELLDQITTADGDIVKDVELRALDLAGKLKNTERAREAARRLFGVKLEPPQELALAKQLTELGLKEESQALLARAPQKFANDIGALLQVMQQLAAQENLDDACAVAEQIIRRTQPIATAKTLAAAQTPTAGQGAARVGAVSEGARVKALEMLSQAGRLTPLMEQSEAQFATSPGSLRLFSQLLELYSAANAIERQQQLLARVAASDASDPQFRLQVARSLVSAGRNQDAVRHYLFVLEKSPNATAAVLAEAETIVQELSNADELARVLLRSKIAVNDPQRISLVARLVERLEGPPVRGALIVELFHKALRDAPDSRQIWAQLLLEADNEVWQQRDLWPFACDLLIPSVDRQTVATWSGVDVVGTMRDRDRRIETLLVRVIDLAERLQKLDELAERIDSVLKKHPNWTGGRLLLGLIKLRQGDFAQARERLDDVRAQAKIVPDMLTCAIGFELARTSQFVELAARFYQPVINSQMSWDLRRVVLEHCRVHADKPPFQELAIEILLSLTPAEPPGELSSQFIATAVGDISTIAKELNQPYIAARMSGPLRAAVMRDYLKIIESDRPRTHDSVSNQLGWLKHVEERALQASAAIKPDMLPLIFQLAIRELPNGNDWRLDLLTHVAGDSVAEMQLHSPILAGLKSAAKDAALWSRVLESLAPLRDKFPDDRAIAIAAAFAELVSPKPASDLKSLAALRRVVADGEVALWLLARECSPAGPHRELGEELSRSALAAAQSQRDPRTLWALLREQGQSAIARGDRDQALVWWTKLVESVLQPRSMLVDQASPPIPLLIHGEMVGVDRPSFRLQRARDLARLSLDAGFPDLSLRTFRVAATQWPREWISEPDVVNRAVVFTWNTLEPRWREQSVVADSIYETLADCVLPRDRLDDVLTFAVPLEDTKLTTSAARRDATFQRLDVGLPASLGLRLVQLAVAESRTANLRERLAARQRTPASELPLQLLRLTLAIVAQDQAMFDEQFAALEKQDWRWNDVSEALPAKQVIRLVVQHAARTERTAKLLDRWLTALPGAISRAEFPAADLRRWLIRHRLAQRQIDTARDLVSAHLRHMEGVWSGAGAMDGQHLRRLELLRIAEQYANAGLVTEALDLLGQVADARWPDRYPDENPGTVLVALENALRSRSADERYLLWRSWALPDDGRTSLRMLSGATDRIKTESGERKADANFKSQNSKLKSSGRMLIEAAAEAQRLPELAQFLEEQMSKRRGDRLHVLLALTRLEQGDVAAAEPLLRKQVSLWDAAGSSSAVTRTRAWDDWLLAAASAQHESLRELRQALALRAGATARDLNDAALLSLLPR